MKLTHYSILVLAKINENLLYWKKPVKFNDLHICSFFNITDCDQNYMQMLNHQINDKKSVGLCSLFSFFFLSSIFRPRPQYCDYFHMKLVDGFLFRVSVDWALKRPGEPGLKNKRFRWVRITGWFRVDGERLGELKCNLQSLAHHRGESPTVYEWRNVKDKTRQDKNNLHFLFLSVLFIYLFLTFIYLLSPRLCYWGIKKCVSDWNFTNK